MNKVKPTKSPLKKIESAQLTTLQAYMDTQRRASFAHKHGIDTMVAISHNI
jgi:hypothetical protein